MYIHYDSDCVRSNAAVLFALEPDPTRLGFLELVQGRRMKS
jgi:hypothetical protein